MGQLHYQCNGKETLSSNAVHMSRLKLETREVSTHERHCHLAINMQRVSSHQMDVGTGMGTSCIYRNEIWFPWWRRQMETFSALLAICAVNSPITGDFHTQRPVMRCFDVFLYLRLSKQSWGSLFEIPSRPLWRHCNKHDQKVVSLPPLLKFIQLDYNQQSVNRWIET